MLNLVGQRVPFKAAAATRDELARVADWLETTRKNALEAPALTEFQPPDERVHLVRRSLTAVESER